MHRENRLSLSYSFFNLVISNICYIAAKLQYYSETLLVQISTYCTGGKKSCNSPLPDRVLATDLPGLSDFFCSFQLFVVNLQHIYRIIWPVCVRDVRLVIESVIETYGVWTAFAGSFHGGNSQFPRRKLPVKYVETVRILRSGTQKTP